MLIQFDWDEKKNKQNWKKHRIWFEEAIHAFNDAKAILYDDPDHSEKEDRFLLLGLDANARLLMVVHCHREDGAVVRIISARKANRKEELAYAQGI